MKVHDNQSRRSNWQLLKRIQDGGPEEEENSCRSACRVHDSEEVDNLQADDSVASVTMLFTPGLFRRSFFSFSSGAARQFLQVREGRWEGGREGAGICPRQWTGADCRLCVCLLCVYYRPFLPHSEPSRHQSRSARQAAACRSRAKEIEPLT